MKVIMNIMRPLYFEFIFYKRIELIKVAYFCEISYRKKIPIFASFDCVVSHLERLYGRHVGIIISSRKLKFKKVIIL
jgi:hypothetical protein